MPSRPLRFAYRGQVFIELAAVGWSEGRWVMGIAHHLIENALAHGESARMCGGRFGDVEAEETLEEILWVGDGRQRLRFGPGYVVGVGAGVAVVAVAGHGGLLRGRFRAVAAWSEWPLARGDLIGGGGEIEVTVTSSRTEANGARILGSSAGSGPSLGGVQLRMSMPFGR